MDQSGQFHGLGFSEAAIYRIVVGGDLDERRVEDMVDARIQARSPRATKLLLRVKDQASLSGALDALNGLHLVILWVELRPRPGETRS